MPQANKKVMNLKELRTIGSFSTLPTTNAASAMEGGHDQAASTIARRQDLS
jgi:hypothetical protein